MSTVVITGANRGIGLAYTQHYLDQGDTVYAICREPSRELEASDARIIKGIDIANETHVASLAQQLEGITIDILINNAGILMSETLGDIQFAQIEKQFLVNAMAPLRVTEALLGKLQKGSKIALMTSRMGSIEDNGSGAYYGYRMSKAALNAAGKSLAIDLKEKGIAVAILHPGFVSTAMVGYGGDISPEESVARLVKRIEALDLSNSGTFWHANGEVLPW